jgi:S-formylglutathione hydrolase FrmB
MRDDHAGSKGAGVKMRRLVGMLVAASVMLLAAAASAQAGEATITAEKAVGPRVLELTISTPAFVEPTHIDIDLPTNYESEPERRWPVTYFLAGTQNTYKSFNSVVHGVALTENFPSIVVSPNGDSGYWSDWYNGGAFGPPEYETFVVDQLIPLIDANFRTIADRAHRAIAGVSMGGYGSMMIAARHPDLFGEAASISGATDSNNPLLGAALSTSSTFDGGAVDAIYGPRATQEVRWRGHNPTDLASNLGGLDLQIRTANGTPNPAIGEELLSVDTVSCVIEAGVYQGSTSLNAELDRLGIPHLWKDYGPGCHTPENFEREIADTIATFTEEFAAPPVPPTVFDYKSIEPQFDVYGWRVAADPHRALEFMQLHLDGLKSMKIVGSGTTSVTSPPLFGDDRAVILGNAEQGVVVPDSEGRIRFTVDLGPPDTVQQYTAGADPAEVARTVTFTPVPADPRASDEKPADAEGEDIPVRGRATACVVPRLQGVTPREARKRIRRSHCRLAGAGHRSAGGTRVVAQQPKPGRRLPGGTTVHVKLG